MAAGRAVALQPRLVAFDDKSHGEAGENEIREAEIVGDPRRPGLDDPAEVVREEACPPTALKFVESSERGFASSDQDFIGMDADDEPLAVA